MEPQPTPPPTQVEATRASVAGAVVLVTDLANKTLAVKEGETFLYSDTEGNLDDRKDYGLGLYHKDTRFLSHFVLKLSGRDPVLLSSSSERAYMAFVDLTNMDLYEDDQLAVPQQSLNIRRIRAINGRLFERERRGTFRPPVAEGRVAEFGYIGSDKATRRTRIDFASEPDQLEVHGDLVKARFRLRLGAYQTRLVSMTIEPILEDEEPPAKEFDSAVHELRRSYEGWERECTEIVTDNEVFNELLGRGLRDLRALYTEMNGGGVVAAGIPWYVTTFGRDSLISAHQLFTVNPRPAIGT